MAAQLPGSVDSPTSSSQTQPLEREYLTTLQEASRALFSQAPQASGLRNQAKLSLTSSTLGSDGRPSPLTALQQQQQNEAFPEQYLAPVQGRGLDLSRSTLGQTERDALVDAVLKYQELLVRLGHAQEAQAISSSLVAARRAQRRLSFRPSSLVAPLDDSATGLDILLKDGFLAFLQRLTPHLPPVPQQVVKFKNVSYTSQIRRTTKGYATVGSKLVDCFAPCMKEKAPIEMFHILDDCTGYLMPGTLTLVLGPPGCGKSSFHQVLAGRAWTDKTTKLTGEVTYNHQPVAETQYRRLATYIGQTDKHLPTLTVRETCDFARDCTTDTLVTDESHRQYLFQVGGAVGEALENRGYP
ncbi:pleiotropic drug resistance protein [Klebsormidium nitens]|uniref:Pleiotropic drug resistance protein n=1 Tax=Klebsormidium nitens TaxID=105231 RepID=A0A1Y1HLW7_KLENI|nr:pleiotropic drug resistance protein [Klebsormidium nitens]|eukprot:GAQ79604.1 pleiotropic drug resistance protein [Klebsormidium nitens]